MKIFNYLIIENTSFKLQLREIYPPEKVIGITRILLLLYLKFH